jgi:hypothetical protein
VSERVDAVDRLGARRIDTSGTEIAREGDDGVEQSCRELRGRRTVVRRTNVVPSCRFTWGCKVDYRTVGRGGRKLV